MDRKVGLRMCELTFVLEKDPEYQALLAEYRRCDRTYLDALKTMTEDQRDAVLDYGSISAQLYLKIMESACTMLIQAEGAKTRE